MLDSSGSVVINKPKATWTATLGLVVHAAADGIALGAASVTSRFNVELIVFMAIILHKVTLRFGDKQGRSTVSLGTGSVWSGFVSDIGWGRSQTHSSASADLLSRCTCDGYFHIRFTEKCTMISSFLFHRKLFFPSLSFFQQVQQSYSIDSTGLAMLFSAGTFLFVATVHVLPEIQSHYDDRQFRALELLILIFGCCCPILLSIGHTH